ncbi:hypothetical protein BDK51DRAFT_32815, partial [Blyttiomyces helicus]
MKSKTTALLKKVQDITIVRVGDEPDSDDGKLGWRRAALGPGLVIPTDVAMDRAGEVAGEQAEDLVDEGSVQMRKWREASMAYRFALYTERQEQAEIRFPEQKALVRDPEKMAQYAEAEAEFIHRNERRRKLLSIPLPSPSEPAVVGGEGAASANGARDDQGVAGDASTADGDPGTGEDADAAQVAAEPPPNAFLPEIAFRTNAMPPIYSPPLLVGSTRVEPEELFKDTTPTAFQNLPSLSDYKPMKVIRNSRLVMNIHRNITELRRMKDAHSKIVALETKMPDEMPKSQPLIYQSSRDDSTLPPLAIDSRVGAGNLKQVTGMMLAHAGFDGTSIPFISALDPNFEFTPAPTILFAHLPLAATDSSISSLTDAAIHHLMNLGRTLRVYMDRFGSSMPPTDMLLHAFRENGGGTIEALDTHIRHDVERYGGKLADLRVRLDGMYYDMLQNPDDQEVADEDIEIENESEGIISGNFLEELGIDVFNLKDFGLDLTSVPTEVWNKKSANPIKARARRRAARADAPEEAASEAPIDIHQPPPILPWAPVDRTKQIGLLKAFYEARVNADDMIE